MHGTKDEPEKKREVQVDIKVTDCEIQALADGELNAIDKSEITDRIARTPKFQKRYEELCQQRDLLRMWWSLSGKSS